MKLTRRVKFFYLALLLIILYLSAAVYSIITNTFYLSRFIDENGISYADKNLNLKEYTKLILNLNKANSSKKKDITEINIIINPLDLYKIELERQSALKIDLLGSPKYHKAKIIINGQYEHTAKIRLKGELKDNWKNLKRSSLKIVFEKKNKFFPQEIGVQKPSSRQFPYDFIHNKLKKEFGLIDNRRGLVRVKLNSIEWGIMDFEERFGSTYFENSKLIESPILKLGDHEGIFFRKLFFKETFIGNPNFDWNFYNENNYKKFRKIISYFMQNYLNNNEKIINLSGFLNEFILASLFNDFHPLNYSNIRFYLNKFTGKLDPITSDASYTFEPEPRYINNLNYILIFQKIVSSPEFKNAYEKEIKKIDISKLCEVFKTEIIKLNEIFFLEKETECILKTNENVMNYFKKIETMNNVSLRQFNIEKINKRFSKFKHINFIHFLNGDVKIFNLVNLPIYLHKVVYKENGITKEHIIDRIISPNNTLKNPFFINTQIKGNLDDKISLRYKIYDKSFEITNHISLIPENELSLNFNIIEEDYYFNKKDYKFDKTTIFTKPVLIKSGIKIRLCKNCSLIFLSDLITERSKKGKETIIYGDDIGGLAIIDENKDNTVLIDGIKIKNSNGIKNIFSDYSAALLLYNISNFTLNNLKIMNANVEDAINLIDSNGKLFNVHIDGSNIGSDGIDSDFSNIDAEMIHLENLNGDGIDFSKSKFKLKNFKAKNIGDKAVSVGETSSGVIYDANINSSETCIASKDNSYVLIKKLYGDLCNSFTFASYIKKRNYTHAKIKVEKEIKYKNYLLTEEAIIENGDNLLKPNSSYKEIFEFYNYGTFKKYKIQ